MHLKNESPGKPSYTIIFDLQGVLFSYHPDCSGEKQFQIIKGMPNILHQIAAQTDQFGHKSHKLYVLSNVNLNAYRILMTHYAPIFSYFDGIVTSAKSGYQKPEPSAYKYLLQKYNLMPTNCLFIDDKKANVSGAQKVGMHGFIYQNSDQLKIALDTYNVFHNFFAFHNR